MLSREDQVFLEIVHNRTIREDLLVLLREIGLLDAFLRAENGTTPTE